jgi:hypothetical protein
MTIMTVELVDPRVKALLEDLEKLNLIRIKEEEEVPMNRFSALLSKLRSNEKDAPSLEEISAEVDQVRTQRLMNNG